MNYTGKLYGKGHGRTYFPLVLTSEDVDRMESELNELRAKYAMHHAEAERLTEVIRAATVLMASKGRHNTMLAYEGLREALKTISNP